MPEVEDEPVPVLPYVSPTRTSPPQIPTQQGEPPVTSAMNRGPSAESRHSTTSVPAIPPSVSPDPLKAGTPFGGAVVGNYPGGPTMPSTSSPAPFPPTGTSSPGLPGHPWAPPQNPPPPSLSTTSPFPGQPPQRQSPPTAFPPSFPNSSSPPPTQFSRPVPPPRPTSQTPSNYYTQSPVVPPSNYAPGQPSAAPSNYAPGQPSAPPLPSNYYAPQHALQPVQHTQTPSYFPPQPQVVVDDEAIAKAQKHARWAISALNYEDIDTAVKELKNALNTLGVRS